MHFSKGDLVRLKSGGSPMTVHEVDADLSGVSCIWLDSEQGIQRETFPAIVLEKMRSDED
jgi:uncharacterized protein YodC (DUF2158 family)